MSSEIAITGTQAGRVGTMSGNKGILHFYSEAKAVVPLLHSRALATPQDTGHWKSTSLRISHLRPPHPTGEAQADSPVQRCHSSRAWYGIWKLLSQAPHHVQGIMLFAALVSGELVPSSCSRGGLEHPSRALLRASNWPCNLQSGCAHANVPGGFYQGVIEIIHNSLTKQSRTSKTPGLL